MKWADTVRPTIAATYPELPVEDRDADVWEPLVMVADAAGGRWPALARHAAVRMTGDLHRHPQTLGVRLLADIRQVMGDDERVSTTDLLGRLHSLETAPWASIHGEPIDSRFLARLLSKYDIQTGRTVRIGEWRGKGYRRDQFADAWARYLPACSAGERDIRDSVTGSPPTSSGGERDIRDNVPNQPREDEQ